MQVMKRGRNYLPSDFFVDRFISGLNENIRHLVQRHQPESLMKGYYFARQYEKNHNSNAAVIRRGLQVPIPQGQARLNPIRNARQGGPRQCWYCPGNYVPGHRCPNMTRALNMMILQGHPVEDEEEAQQLLLEAVAEVEGPEVIANVAPAVNAAQVAYVEQPADDNINMMEISAATYNGSTSDSTISLLIHINGVPPIALADTCSTNTFLDKQFAMDHNIDFSPMPSRRAKVAGGGILISDAIAYNHQFIIQGKQFSADFHILELGGSDAILGVNWFKLHNPVTFDFIERTLSIEIARQTHTFSDHLVPVDDPMVSLSSANNSLVMKQREMSCIIWKMCEKH
jgi:hypothetical protein